jgi:CheY-like chemotaxis protein/HPt (histidine-containing phosphotransfer) domain-containing protein
VRLRVTDTGIGISPEQQRRLFQPFIQADANTTRNYGGTGLGLSICRRLAEKMGGEISMESAAGSGTVMTLLLRLPISDVALLPGGGKIRRDSMIAHSTVGSTPELLGVSILIADDHPINLRLIERQAALLGFDTTLAADGIEALEKWKTGRYALILTDCHMPRMDGYDLAREIRRIEAASGVTKPIPIIACTANAMESDAKACHDAGMNDYLSKPTTLEALKAKIEHWVTADTAAKPIPAEDTPTATAAVAVAPLEEPPLDANTLADFTGGDASLRREILRQFLASHEPDAIALRAALSSGNCSSIADAAHRVKGASRMVGAQPYADVAERIESAARNYDQIAINNCIADLEKEQARLSAYLRAETGDA